MGTRLRSFQVCARVGRLDGGCQEIPHSLQYQPDLHEGTGAQVRSLLSFLNSVSVFLCGNWGKSPQFEPGVSAVRSALEQATASVWVWKVTAALACSVGPQTFRHVAWCDWLWLEPTWLHHFTCSDFWRRIALNIREAGRGSTEPGRLQAVQAIGWWLEEASIAQVSTNLTDHDVTPIHVAYEEVCKDAAALNLPVVGSEIVGLVPLATLLQVCASHRFYTSHHFYNSHHFYTSHHFYISHRFYTLHHF